MTTTDTTRTVITATLPDHQLDAAGVIRPCALAHDVAACTPDCAPADAPTVTLLVNAYGGWDWTRTTGQATRVTFEGPNADAHAATYVTTHGHLVIEPDTGDDGYPAIPEGFDALIGALFPLCEHQMSLSLCMGPDHFPTAAQERALWG